MAAEGKNKVAQSLVDMQPTAVLELFRIFPDKVNKPTLFLGFHGGSEFDKSITWQGVEYLPVAIEPEGFDILGDGKLPRPKIRIANRNYLVTNFLQNYKDLINAKVVRKKVQVKFLDDVNFEGGNPFGAADSKAELANETWVMGRKTQESKIFVEFELNSPLDLENFSVNSRSVVAKFCGWQYRGEGCRYEGFPVQREDGTPFVDENGKSVVPKYSGPPPISFIESNFAEWRPTKQYDKGEIIWVKSPTINVPPLPTNPNDTNSRPLKTVYVSVKGLPDDSTNLGQNPFENPSFWQKDGCSKKLSACQLRFNSLSDLRFVGGDVTNSSFPAVRISGKQREGSTYIADNTGFFHTNEPKITGVLTGDFTLMGWANVTTNSPRGAGLFATSQRDDGVFPTCRYLNLPISVKTNIRRMGTATSSSVDAAWMGHRISPTNHNSRYNIYNYINLQPTQPPSDTEVEEWNQYIVTHGRGLEGVPENDVINGEGQNAITAINFYVNGVKEDEDTDARVRGNSTNNYAGGHLGNFGSLTERQAAAGTGTHGWPLSDDPSQKGPMPVCFMIGGNEYWYGTSTYESQTANRSSISCINGSIGTWALWNRVLTEEEIRFLVYTPETTDSSPNTITQIPKKYEHCTGNMGTITGSGRVLPDDTELYADSLVAWWEGATGNIGSVTHPTGALMDIHTGGFHLTGSGDFEQVSKSYFEGDATVVTNPTPRNPRFGGFPGTDGFSYGRNTSI